MTPLLVPVRTVRLTDVWEAEKRQRSEAEVRAVEREAVVDPTVFGLRLSTDVMDALGFRSASPADRDPRFHTVRLTVAGHDCHAEVVETAGDTVVIGRYPLNLLGLQVVDGQLVESDAIDTALLPKQF